ncbi:ZIP family metal transporter [Candidatus Saccharibacteria bacterium]|nr:ZIP family metal transporter [Candidatus Saccharibacteria bacterium]
MSDWLILIAAVLAGSLLSLVGGIYLLYGKLGVDKLQRVAVPFAAGALLAAAFLDLLPEALDQGEPSFVMQLTLLGLVIFFVLERSLSWFHHHHNDEHHGGHRQNASLIVIGDTLHNFIDGLAIGAAFLVDPAVGLVTTAAIAAHEIPQEIGDFGLLISKGMARKKVLLVNVISGLATLLGAVIIYGFGGELGVSESVLLALTAGFFIYIAASDIIPTIHAEPERRWANIQTAVLILGIVLVGGAANLAHTFVPHGADEQSAQTNHADESNHKD